MAMRHHVFRIAKQSHAMECVAFFYNFEMLIVLPH
jgi:hypothetical protein